ncbi:unnamed protein product [Cuscuta epithymum]|uniref:Uncharacterized protein n=1 Tax=Cuscuta epithymum TaxID=186058 RepID=A0AAV0F059_9ASTE|nr:unnamed protein product [Cuscuta epithymum]
MVISFRSIHKHSNAATILLSQASISEDRIFKDGTQLLAQVLGAIKLALKEFPMCACEYCFVRWACNRMSPKLLVLCTNISLFIPLRERFISNILINALQHLEVVWQHCFSAYQPAFSPNTYFCFRALNCVISRKSKVRDLEPVW